MLYFSRQANDRFNMPRSREEINRGHAVGRVAKGNEARDIARQRIGRAGNVNNARNLALCKKSKQLRITALSGRIQHHNGRVEPTAGGLSGCKQAFGLSGIATIKGGVFHPVENN